MMVLSLSLPRNLFFPPILPRLLTVVNFVIVPVWWWYNLHRRFGCRPADHLHGDAMSGDAMSATVRQQVS
jgi:hypothetical protein